MNEEPKVLSYEDILHACIFTLNRMSEGCFYKNWGAEFSYKEICEASTKLTEYLTKNTVPWESFSLDQLRTLGFGVWDEKCNLILIPLYLANVFYTKDEKYDKDIRFGCLAYGLPVKDGHIVITDNPSSISTEIVLDK